MTMFDETKNGLVLPVIAPVSADAVAHAVQGAVIDMAGCNAATFLVQIGEMAGGSIQILIEEDDDINMATAVSCSKERGTLVEDPETIVAAGDEKIYAYGYIGTKRYVRLTLTTVGANAKAYSVIVVKSHLRH